MKVLIIGFGSIGKRHYEILKSFQDIDEVDVVSKQKLNNIKSFTKLSEVSDLNRYDYYVIASETSKHHGQLEYICSKVDNKNILVEKPLYSKVHQEFECSNNIFVAYNLRFHPVIEKLRELLSDKKVHFANVICGQYLPTWRPATDYRKSYSADINRGGGVLRDLSHELDYISWLFGKIEIVGSISTKVSDLEINADDIFTAIGLTKSKTIINMSMDYISKTPIRKIVIHTDSTTIEADLIKYSIVEFDMDAEAKVVGLETVERNHTYIKMHQSIISNEFAKLCSFDEGKAVVGIIENITYKEL